MGLFVLVSVVALFFQQSRGIPQDEVEVLLDFKSKLHNATFLHGWQQSNASMACDWEGVTCDPSKQHIVALQLVGYGGTITPLLGRLEQLQELNLSDGSFQGTIPRELGNCTKLRMLDLSYNSLGGAIPPELGHCTGLQSLSLSDNSLGGAIPPELGHCTGLQTLDLSYNSLGGAIPPELGHCTGLQSLFLSFNSLRGAIPPELGHCTGLQTLDLSGNHLVGAIPPELGHCTGLQTLDLSYNSLGGAIPPELGHCTGLQTIDLSGNHLVGAIPPELGHCTGLQTIDLSGNHLVGAIPPELGHCTGLQSLSLSDNSLGSAIPPELGHCTGLQYLSLSYNSLGGAIPASLANLSLLQELFLYGNELDCQVFPRLPRIESIALSCNTTFASVSSELGQGRTIWLQVRGGTGAPPNWLASWKGKRLEVYGEDVESGASISDDYAIPTNVTWLVLSGLNLEGEVPATLLSQLQFLDLSGNQLTSIQAAGDGTPTALESLDLGRNNLTLADLERLTRMKHANLTSLGMSNNALVGNLSWATQFPNPSHSLDLSYNHLSGSIPHNILSRIAFLDLSHNKFTGHLPSDIPGMGGECAVMSLASNELEGSLPLRFPAAMVQLDLSSNRFSGSIPPSLCDGPWLSALSLAGNQLNGSIPYCIANLFILDLSGNRLSGQLPPNLAWFGSRDLTTGALEMTFGFNGGRRTFDGDSFLWFAPVSLDVSSNQLEGEIPAELGKSRLMELNLSSNKFTGSIPRELGNLTKLQALDLSHNLLQGSFPQELCRPPQISLLNVSYNNLSGTVPSCNAMDTKYPGAFDGNAFLCGPFPFVNNSGCQHPQTHTDQPGKQQQQHHIWLFEKLVSPWAFYMGLVMGFYFTFLPMLFYRKPKHS